MQENRSNNLGILFTDDAGNGLTQDFFASIINSFKCYVEKKGYNVVFINCTDEGQEMCSMVAQCKKLDLEGIFVACTHIEDPRVKELLDLDIPAVSVDLEMDRDKSVCISSDNVNGVYNLVDYIVSKGHRKIAYIHSESGNVVTQIRKKAFFEAIEKNGIEIPAEYICEGKFRDMDKASYFTDKLLQLPNPPTCIIYSDDVAAIGGLNTAHARGLEVPRDVAIAGYDGIRVAMQYEPRLTTVRHRSDKMCEVCGKMLLEIIQNDSNITDKLILIDTDLEKGRTV